MNEIPSKYFITKGIGESDTSHLNAFDRALMNAGIAQCNLVGVSSILPKNAKRIEFQKIEPGAITFVVLAKRSGGAGDQISAGVGIAETGNGVHNMIAETSENETAHEIRERLRSSLHEMADARGMTIQDIQYEISTLKVQKKYGAAVAAVVLLPK